MKQFKIIFLFLLLISICGCIDDIFSYGEDDKEDFSDLDVIEKEITNVGEFVQFRVTIESRTNSSTIEVDVVFKIENKEIDSKIEYTERREIAAEGQIIVEYRIQEKNVGEYNSGAYRFDVSFNNIEKINISKNGD